MAFTGSEIVENRGVEAPREYGHRLLLCSQHARAARLLSTCAANQSFYSRFGVAAGKKNRQLRSRTPPSQRRAYFTTLPNERRAAHPSPPRPRVAVEPPLPAFRFSREPTIDDAYRLRKIAAAVAEMSANGGSAAALTVHGQQRRKADAVGERGRLPLGQEAREDVLFQLLSELESVESLARATAMLGAGVSGASGASGTSGPEKTASGRSRGAFVELSASFQRRSSELCRERADQAAAAAAVLAAASAAEEPGDEEGAAAKEDAAAVAALRFRAAAFELYTVLECVKLNPAGEDEDEDPAFLPPGKRGWKHAALCEEAAGWADAVRGAEGARGAALPSAELPEFQVRKERFFLFVLLQLLFRS